MEETNNERLEIMPIKKVPAFETSDGRTFGTLLDAQYQELALMLKLTAGDTIPDVLARMLEHGEEAAAILTSTGRKPRERKKKPGRPKGSRNNVAVPVNNNSVNQDT